jgi:hypothetical protein
VSDRFSNPFTAPRIHYRVAASEPITHPKFGETMSKTWLACGNRTSMRHTDVKDKVTCLRCIKAIKDHSL